MVMKCTVAISAVFQQLGVGGGALTVFYNTAVTNSLPKLPHAVCGKCGCMQKHQVKRKTVLSAKSEKRPYIHIYRDADIGIGQALEIIKMTASCVLIHVDKLR